MNRLPIGAGTDKISEMIPITRQIFADAELIYNFMAESPELPKQADLILAAGTQDLRVADHAAALYLKGLAPIIVCSGGFGKVTAKVFSKPEAELFAERCIENGVPSDAIVVEDRSTNTGENFRFSKELCEAFAVKVGIIACKPYMARRAWATGTRQWPEVRWHASGMPLGYEDYPTKTITREDTIQLMVGDLQRLQVYEKLGFQVHTDIPETIWNAWKRLVKAGFDQYVIPKT